MKKNFKKYVISLCALGCVGAMAVASGVLSASPAKAAEPTEESNYFAMVGGAQVRTVPDSLGIRFTTNVGEYYYNAYTTAGYEVSFGALVSKSSDVSSISAEDATTYLADIPCTKTVKFDENGDFEYTSAIVYDKTAYEFTDAQWTSAIGMELTARAYIKLEKAGSTTYEYADATDTTRSMRAVANDEIIDGTDEDIISDLNEYLGTQTRKTNFEAYETAEAVEGKVPMTVSGLSTGYTQAYIGAKHVGTVSGNAISFDESAVESMGLTLGEKYALSLFDDSNNVYSMQVMYVTDKLTVGADMKVFNVGEDQTEHNTGYYILGNDIQSTKTNFDMDSATTGYQFHTKYGYGTSVIKSGSVAASTVTVGFAGTLDGQGYQWRIEGPGELGLFAYLGDGAMIKNISFDFYSTQNIQNRSYVGNNVLAYAMDGRVDLDNVHIKIAHNAFTSNGVNRYLIYNKGVNLYMNNVIVENTVYSKDCVGGVLFFSDAGRGSLTSDDYQNSRYKNVYVIAGTADDETTTDVDETVVPYMTNWHLTYFDTSKLELRYIVAGNDEIETYEHTNGTTYESKQYKNVLRYVSLADLYETFTESNPNPLAWNWNGTELVWNK
ncbi:MAG: hypothetical protein IJ506_07510 [Clostridia bacterium]|nr:hypothetical protein [Clostridia bacterium]MBQ8658968.1 hypothetical protein [Clostridia bacterium]